MTMGIINIFFQVAILFIVSFGNCEADSHFHCDTPEDWLVGTLGFFPFDPWPNGTVTYELHTSLTPGDIIEVNQAINDIQNKTCVRFVLRDKEESYVSIEHDNSVCGQAHVCKVGGYQYARFGQNCVRASIMVHELGHTLCLGHEMTRFDRDDYLTFRNCSEGSFQEIDDLDTGGYIYDYTSIMGYQCTFCQGGWPKKEGVYDCSIDATTGLSVMDADKLNDFYSCQECLVHRWRNTENLTDVWKAALVSFGKTVKGNDLYLCRAYIGPGAIVPGQYDLGSNTCTVTSNGAEFKVKDHVQVFTVLDKNTRKRYGVTKLKQNLVKVGRTRAARNIFAAVAEYKDYNGRYGRVLGKVYETDFSKAYFSIDNDQVVKKTFSYVTCL